MLATAAASQSGGRTTERSRRASLPAPLPAESDDDDMDETPKEDGEVVLSAYERRYAVNGL